MARSTALPGQTVPAASPISPTSQPAVTRWWWPRASTPWASTVATRNSPIATVSSRQVTRPSRSSKSKSHEIVAGASRAAPTAADSGHGHERGQDAPQEPGEPRSLPAAHVLGQGAEEARLHRGEEEYRDPDHDQRREVEAGGGSLGRLREQVDHEGPGVDEELGRQGAEHQQGEPAAELGAPLDDGAGRGAVRRPGQRQGQPRRQGERRAVGRGAVRGQRHQDQRHRQPQQAVQASCTPYRPRRRVPASSPRVANQQA